MQVKILCPTDMSEIPLQSYQKWLKIEENSNDEELLAHKFIEIFLGLQLKDAVRVSAKDLKKYIAKLTLLLKEKPEFKRTFKFHGLEFGFVPDLENISWGEYIDIEENLMKWETFHIALSVLYRPIKRKVKDSYELVEYEASDEWHEAFKFVPLDIALSASVFFWNLERELLTNTLSYLNDQVKMEKKEIPTNIAKKISSINNGIGITQYIDLLKVTLDDLLKSLPYLSIGPLPSYPTRSKKKQSKRTYKKDILEN